MACTPSRSGIVASLASSILREMSSFCILLDRSDSCCTREINAVQVNVFTLFMIIVKDNMYNKKGVELILKKNCFYCSDFVVSFVINFFW